MRGFQERKVHGPDPEDLGGFESDHDFERDVSKLIETIDQLLATRKQGKKLPEWQDPNEYLAALETRLKDTSEHDKDSVIRTYAQKLLETKVPEFRQRLQAIEEAAA